MVSIRVETYTDSPKRPDIGFRKWRWSVKLGMVIDSLIADSICTFKR